MAGVVMECSYQPHLRIHLTAPRPGAGQQQPPLSLLITSDNCHLHDDIDKYTIRSIVCEVFCHMVIWSSGHLVIWSSGHQVIRSSGHPIIQSSNHPVIQSSSHPAIQSSSHPVIHSFIHSFILSFGHLIIWSSWQPVIPPSCYQYHPIITSFGHLVIPLSCNFNMPTD